MEQDFPKSKLVHRLFELTIVLKGVSGFWEILVGFLVLFFKRVTIYRFLVLIAGHIAFLGTNHAAKNYVIHHAGSFSLNTKYFIAFYLLFYGVVNLWLVVSLLQNKHWAYPCAIAFFLIFSVYVAYRALLHQSLWLWLLTAFDLVVILLIWLEYKRVTAAAAKKPAT